MNLELILVDYSNKEQGEDLITLLAEYALDPMGGGEPLPKFSQDNLIATLKTVPGAFSILAYVDGKAAGLSNCFLGFSTFACKPLVNIHDVVVSAQYRGTGLCRKMLSKIEQVALTKGCCKLTLEVLPGNEPAKHAYGNFGFQAYELSAELGGAEFWQKSLK